MTDEPQKPEPLALPAPSTPRGNLRLNIALALSVLALAVSVVSAAKIFTQEPPLPPLPVVSPIVDMSGLEDRIAKQETRQGQFAEDLAKLAQHVEGGPAAEATAEATPIPAPATQLDHKAIEAALNEQVAAKTRAISDWALFQGMRLKLRDGTDYSAERKGLSVDVAKAASIKALDTAKPADISDKRLREDLRQVAPRFSAQEKMQNAKGMLEKIAARAEGLVTIRPKEGVAVVETAQGKALAALDVALTNHDWVSANKAADELKTGAPAEFAVFHERLRQRAEAEAALDALETATLASLREPQADKPEATP